MKHLFTFFVISILLSFVAITNAAPGRDASGKDWPKWRSQNQDGKATQMDVFKFDEGYGIKLAWKKPLGSGYSSVSIADGRAVTTSALWFCHRAPCQRRCSHPRNRWQG